MIRHGANDHRVRFEMRDRIQAVLKYMDKKYGEDRWVNNELALVDPQFLTLQIWIEKNPTLFEQNFFSKEWQRVYRLRMQGKGPTEIADILGMHKGTVTSWIKQMKLHGKLDNAGPIIKRPKVQDNQNLAYPKPPREELIRLLDSGMNKSEIAKKLGVGRKVLYKWLRKDDLMEYGKKANWGVRTEDTVNV